MEIRIPDCSLILLIGATSSGKSTFARQHFLPTEIISSDYCRAIVDDDENSMDATADAFDVLHFIVAKRLKRGKLTVVDATNVQQHGRQKLLQLAKKYHVLSTGIIFDLPESVLITRHNARADRNFGIHVIKSHLKDLRRTFRQLKKEGVRTYYNLKSEEEVNQAVVKRFKLLNDKREITGPFDIIGDVHGCADELEMLLEKLNYTIERDEKYKYGFQITPPADRKAFFVGDLTDRGPDSPRVLKIVMSMVENKTALCVCGNHDDKLLRVLKGRNIQLKYGLEETMMQMSQEPESFHEEVRVFLKGLISHYVVDGGKLVVAHAGLKESMQGRASGKVRSFCLYGDTTGEIDEFGLPVRLNWALDYRGKSVVVYGHTPVPSAEWLNNTIDIDTGCVFGGKLTALRYPERELVEIPAKEMYSEPKKPLTSGNAALSAQQVHDDILDIKDVTGKRAVTTALRKNVTLREDNSIAALEIMSRFGMHPKWLIHLPPTMSPSETSKKEGFLEHPENAFDYYKKMGMERVICEEKQMGSRGLIIVCKDETVSKNRFGAMKASNGVAYTRTGRPFFTDSEIEKTVLERLQTALTKANIWAELETDWILLDCEILPWSFKAKSLIQTQYAAVGTSGKQALSATQAVLAKARARGLEVEELESKYEKRLENIKDYQIAYRAYCENVDSVDDIQIAPFHILATEGKVHTDKNHEWHMRTIHQICAANAELLRATAFRIVDLNDEKAIEAATNWWLELTNNQGEGMVVKPYDFIARTEKDIIQPAIKCRGREYLRIIYGADYTLDENLVRLRKRNLGRKRSLALREFALGIEALERFVKQEPIRKVHECVFGVLALESERVDPRL